MNRASNDPDSAATTGSSRRPGTTRRRARTASTRTRSPRWCCDTLEGYLGEQTMARVMRTYHERWRFKHPRSEDFFALVNEVTGQDWRWYFDQVVRGTDIVDYDIGSARDEAGSGTAQGVFDEAGRPQDGVAGRRRSEGPRARARRRSRSSRSIVVVRRSGERDAPGRGGLQVRGQARRAADVGRPRPDEDVPVRAAREARVGRRRSRSQDRARRELAEQRPAARARRPAGGQLDGPMAVLRSRTSSPRWDCCRAAGRRRRHDGKHQGRPAGGCPAPEARVAALGVVRAAGARPRASGVALVERRARLLARSRVGAEAVRPRRVLDLTAGKGINGIGLLTGAAAAAGVVAFVSSAFVIGGILEVFGTRRRPALLHAPVLPRAAGTSSGGSSGSRSWPASAWCSRPAPCPRSWPPPRRR